MLRQGRFCCEDARIERRIFKFHENQGTRCPESKPRVCIERRMMMQVVKPFELDPMVSVMETGQQNQGQHLAQTTPEV